MAHFRSEARIDILVLESFTREVLPVGATSFIVFFSFTDPSLNPSFIYATMALVMTKPSNTTNFLNKLNSGI